MSAFELAKLVDAAGAATAAGNWQDAERLWLQVAKQDPRNVRALFSLGVHAYQRGDTTRALEMLNLARAAAPRDPMIPLTMSVAYRDRGDDPGAWMAIMEALEIEPYFLPALLSKAEHLERVRGSRAAAAVFRNTLKVAPLEPAWPPALRRRLEHARKVVEQDTEECAAFLRQRLGYRGDMSDVPIEQRWDEAVSILAGRSRPYQSECNQLHVPRLPALPFFPSEQFAWIGELEAQADAIRNEFEALLSAHEPLFEPYIQYRPGDPVNQWHELNHSRRWNSFHLWAHGQCIESQAALCPVTTSALSRIEAVHIDGLCPNAMFSALSPRTTIPPHTGETNARLVAHLPLIVPDQCSLRVGYEHRSWEPGKVLVFDDTIEHEARNDSDELRVVLIFDVWNPLLSREERAAASTLASAMRDYRQSGTR